MPRLLSRAERLAREQERENKRKAQQDAKNARLKRREEARQRQHTHRASRKLTALINKAVTPPPDNNPYWGKSECKRYGTPTVAVLMATSKRRAKSQYESRKRELRFVKKLHTLFPMIENAWFVGMDDEDIQWVGRAIGTIVFDVPTRYIGWRSEKYHEARVKTSETGNAIKPSPEHIYPRQLCGELLVHHMMINEGLEFDHFVAYVNVFRQIAHVLSDENQDMKEYQGRSTFICPEHAYEVAGIRMIEMHDGEKLLRLEDVTPPDVLETVFGERLDELHKYSS